MAVPLRSTLVGTTQSPRRRIHLVGLAIGVFAMTLAAYTLDVFSISGGIVWIPVHAALLGMGGAGWVGYAQDGLVFAWLVTYTSLLGYHAHHAFFGLSGRTVSEQLAYFVELDGLAVLAVEGVVFGTVAFGLAAVLRRATAPLRQPA